MQIEFLETVKLGAITFEAGDRKTFSDAEGRQYIQLGWAKDVATGEQGERKPGANGPIVPDKVSQQA